MKLPGLLRILWARRLIVVTPVVGTLLGAVVVLLTFPPRYEASSRVILDLTKPDPVTGFRVTDKARDAYVAGQITMLRTPDVTDRAVDASGWLESPDIVAAWQAAPDKGDDLRRWAGRRLGLGIGADVVPETNILEIKYQSSSPDSARMIADNIRSAFIDASVAQARATAGRQATELSAQADKERQRLVDLQAFKANLERQTGTILGDNGSTPDAQQALQAIRIGATLPSDSKRVTVRDPSQRLRDQLGSMDASIAAAGRTLGPNNPAMMEMQRRRQVIVAKLAGTKPADPVSDTAIRRLELATSVIRQSTSRIHSVSGETLALRLVQDEIKRRRDLFDKASMKAGQQLMVSNISNANLTPIGATAVNPKPIFPNYALILGVGGGLGLMVGALLAFIVEALGRRAREVDDLRGAVGAPILGVLPAITLPKGPRRTVEKARRSKKAREPKSPGRKAKLARA